METGTLEENQAHTSLEGDMERQNMDLKYKHINSASSSKKKKKKRTKFDTNANIKESVCFVLDCSTFCPIIATVRQCILEQCEIATFN